MGVHRYVVGLPDSLGRAALRAPYERAAHRYHASCAQLLSSLRAVITRALRRYRVISLPLSLELAGGITLAPSLG